MRIIMSALLLLGLLATLALTGCSDLPTDPSEQETSTIKLGKLGPDGEFQELDETVWISSAAIFNDYDWHAIQRENGLAVPTGEGFDLKLHTGSEDFISDLAISLSEAPDDTVFVVNQLVTDETGNFFLIYVYYHNGHYYVAVADGDVPRFYLRLFHNQYEPDDELISNANNWKMTESQVYLPVNVDNGQGGVNIYFYAREEEWTGDDDWWSVDDQYYARLYTRQGNSYTPVDQAVTVTHMSYPPGSADPAAVIFVSETGEIIPDHNDDWEEINAQTGSVIIYFGEPIRIPPAFLNPLIGTDLRH